MNVITKIISPMEQRQTKPVRIKFDRLGLHLDWLARIFMRVRLEISRISNPGHDAWRIRLKKRVLIGFWWSFGSFLHFCFFLKMELIFTTLIIDLLRIRKLPRNYTAKKEHTAAIWFFCNKYITIMKLPLQRTVQNIVCL